MMSCPRCGGEDLWDDNLWWGCNKCGYAAHAGTSEDTFMFAKDIPGLPRSRKEMREGYVTYSAEQDEEGD
jgi:hypothetical protein